MIIGLTGRAGAGKSTVAEYLEKTYGFERRSFAAPLYASAAALLDCSVDELKKWKNDPNWKLWIRNDGDASDGHMYGFDFRTFLQRYGTEAHRDVFGENFWVSRAMTYGAGAPIVFDDVRFDNEAEAIREAGGIIVRIDRSDARLYGEAATHPSEAGVPADVVLTNNMEIVDLLEDVRHLLADVPYLTGDRNA